MKKEFYTLFRTTTIDSILMGVNHQDYGTITSRKDPAFDPDRDTNKNDRGYHYRDQLETMAAWRPLTKTNQDANPGCVFLRNQIVLDNNSQPVMVHGAQRNGKAPKTKSIDECVYDWMDSRMLNPSTNGTINYDTEYMCPDMGQNKNESAFIVELLMLYKWIAGRMLIKHETLEITPQALKALGFERSFRSYAGLFSRFFAGCAIVNQYDDSVWRIKITQPAASVDLVGGPGYIHIDYISPNNKNIFEEITKDHEEAEKIVSTDREGDQETSRLSTASYDTRMVF